MSGRLSVGLLLLASLGLADREKRARAVPPDVKQEFEGKGKGAIVVGIGAYDKDPALAPLQFARGDALLIADALEQQQYKVVRLLNEKATRENVLAAVDELGKGLATVVFFFSGHGVEVEGANFLVTYGATLSDMKTAGLAIHEVEARIKDTGAQREIFWIDACRSPVDGQKNGARSFDRLDAARGQRALYSTSEKGVSWESTELRRGVFTHFLYEGLMGKAAGSDGLVTMRDLASYVQFEVSRWAGRTQKKQIPVEKTAEATDDFLVAGVPKRIPTSGPGVTNLQTRAYPNRGGITAVLDFEREPASREPGEIELLAWAGGEYAEIVRVSGELPGTPVTLAITGQENTQAVDILEPPAAGNGWRRIRLSVRPDTVTKPVRVVLKLAAVIEPQPQDKRKKK